MIYMRTSSLERDEIRTRNLFLGIFYFCAASMAAITFYALYVSIGEYLTTGKVVIGEVLVNTDFPVHGLAKLCVISDDCHCSRVVLCN